MNFLDPTLQINRFLITRKIYTITVHKKLCAFWSLNKSFPKLRKQRAGNLSSWSEASNWNTSCALDVCPNKLLLSNTAIVTHTRHAAGRKCQNPISFIFFAIPGKQTSKGLFILAILVAIWTPEAYFLKLAWLLKRPCELWASSLRCTVHTFDCALLLWIKL